MIDRAPAESPAISVTLAWSPRARTVEQRMLRLPAGATLQEALEYPGGDWPRGWDAGVWGRKAVRAQALSHGDRIELYRPLQVDPKTARRKRFSRQGVRNAGLFAATRRPGRKPGY